MKRRLLARVVTEFIVDEFLRGEIGDHSVRGKLTKKEAFDYLNKSLGHQFFYVMEELNSFMDDDLVDTEEDPHWLIAEKQKMNDLFKEDN